MISDETIQMYTSWRDDILKNIGEDICQKCSDPRKNNLSVNIKDPLKYKCRCDEINKLLTSAADIDSDINSLLKHP